jgi:hypothetical protein
MGTAPLTVYFTIQNNTHSYTATFGDGQIVNLTTETGNSHVYSLPGTYSPDIAIRNTSTHLTRTNYITVNGTGNVGEFYMDIGAVDPKAGGAFISGVHLNILDKNSSIWNNVTPISGSVHFPSGAGRTYDVYATATGYANAQSLGLSAYPSAFYLVPMYAPSTAPPIGSVNLNVLVYGSDQVAPLAGATVTATPSGGAQQSINTDAGGNALFVVPNNTLIYLTAVAGGYSKATTTYTTTTTQDQFTQITINRISVTPTITQTPLPGETTVRPTQDPNDPAITGNTNAKAQEMMNWLAMNGLSLVQLCFLITILALIGVKFGGK